jgi:sugar/nucleoside kinase (ribokinase family)
MKELGVSGDRLDVVAIGNAIVDILAPASDALVAELGMTRGGMQLVDAEGAAALYARMGSAVEASGGSAANTMAGLAGLGGSCGFIGQIANDQFGGVFAHDIRAIGVEFSTPPREGEPPTGQCLIFVSPDGQRTMNTFLGAAQHLDQGALDKAMIERADVLYLEGYLWTAPESRGAITQAMAIARAAGCKVAFTLSDTFVILGHGDEIRAMMAKGEIDILFANENEISTLMGTDDFDAAVSAAAAQVPTLVATRGADGAVAMQDGVRSEVAAEPVGHVLDTTGAGDLFAAGFLAGRAQGRSVSDCLTMGAVCAAEIISHYGPRPEADLKALAAARLG